MLDLFKTATGAYNWVLLFSVVAWIPSTAVIVSNFVKHRKEVTSAHQAAKLSEEQKEEQERLRKEADRLRVEAEARLAKAEKEIADLRPKPLPHRILATIKKIGEDRSPGRSLEANGPSSYKGMIAPYLFLELQALAAEDSKQEYIVFKGGTPVMEMVTQTPLNAVKFELLPKLLEEAEQDIHGNGP